MSHYRGWVFTCRAHLWWFPVPLTLSVPAVCLQNWMRDLFAASSGRTEGKGRWCGCTEESTQCHSPQQQVTVCDNVTAHNNKWQSVTMSQHTTSDSLWQCDSPQQQMIVSDNVTARNSKWQSVTMWQHTKASDSLWQCDSILKQVTVCDNVTACNACS